jgi:tetratricopeptide (TPR) repeat protein
MQNDNPEEVQADGAEDVIVQGLVPVRQFDLTLMYEAGYLLIELGKHQEAEDIFQGVASLVPDSEAPMIALGHLYFSQGHYNPALRHHQRAVEINPKSAAAHAACAEALLFLHKPRAALEALQTAMRLEPEGAIFEFAKALKEAHDIGMFAQDNAPRV